MTDTSDVIDTMTAWRYWHIPSRRGQPRDTLQPLSSKDRTVWGPGITHALCRRDPTHKPPHPECTCGVFVMLNPVDLQYAVAVEYWAGDQYERLAKLGRHGTIATPLPPGKMVAQVPWLEEQANTYQQWDSVIGRVQVHGAIKTQLTPDNAAQLPTWRAASARIEALYVSSRVTRDTDRLCAALSRKYAVTCEMGFPPYTQRDWDSKARNAQLKTDAPWKEVGLYPPGQAPRSPKFFTVTTPPDTKRRR